jgi:hypothetical protein
MSVGHVQADDRQRGVHELSRELELVGGHHDPDQLFL